MVDVATHPNLVPIIFGDWPKICVALHYHAGKQHSYDLPILAAFLELHPSVRRDVEQTRLVSWFKVQRFKVQNSFIFPPNWQHNLFVVNISFWFIFHHLRSFLINVVINHSVFVASNQWFQIWINFVAFQRRCLKWIS